MSTTPVLVLVAYSALLDTTEVVGGFASIEQLRDAADAWREQAGVRSVDILTAQTWHGTRLVDSVEMPLSAGVVGSPAPR